jgi:Arc/MetJ family transcription regulator
MRTTLTLDPDVAARIEQLRQKRRLGLKDAVNLALRLGLEQLERRSAPARDAYVTPTVDAGRLLVPSLDDVVAVLDFGEGVGHR